MATFHAIVWLDHSEAHVLMFDREHLETQRVKSRSHHKPQNKAGDTAPFFDDIAKTLEGTHEVLLTGPGLTRNRFREWCQTHRPKIASLIVDSIPADHPSDAQLVALAKRYFKKYDRLATDPGQV